MNDIEWLVAHGAVFLAGILQTTTGAGLGLIVGPSLLLVLGSDSAIDVAIVLNLLISAVILPWEVRKIDPFSLKPLALGTIAGIPAGLVVASLLTLNSLKFFAAVTIGFGVLQIWTSSTSKSAARKLSDQQALLGGGFVSGIMSTSLAMPGPVATWAMLRIGLLPSNTRATLRCLFLFSYGLALTVRCFRGIEWGIVLSTSIQLSAALLAGICIGLLIRSTVKEDLLREVLLVILAIVAVSLFADLAMSA